MDEGSSRRALAYVAAWLPFTAVWFLLIFQFGASPQTAAISAATHTLWAGSLSLLIWWRTGREPYPDPVNVFFLGRHAVYATLFGATIVSANILFFSAYEQIPVGKLLADQLPFIPWQMLTWACLYGLVAGVCYTARMHRLLRDQQVAAARAQALAAEAQLEALRAKIQPHFLFNALHSLSSLVEEDPEAASQALERLGALLRYALDEGAGDAAYLADEWDFTRDYLALEQLRFGSRLRVDVNVEPDALDHQVPPFVLQPLVENAIRHGVAQRPGPGRVAVDLTVAGRNLRLRVSDDGPGSKPEEIASSAGVGLRALRERLAARYGSHASLRIDTEPGRGFTACVQLPAEPGRARISA